MRTFFRFMSREASRFFPAEWLFNRETPPFLPFYHVVSNERLPHVLNYPYRDVPDFIKELDFYLKYFQPVTLEELLLKKPNREKIFHLSFDDGLCECYEVIAPLLQKKGIPATFFINTAFVDNKGLFHKYKASLILDHLRENPVPEVNRYLQELNLGGSRILTAGISRADLLNEIAGKIGLDFSEFLTAGKPYLTSKQIKTMAAGGFTFGAHSHNHPEFWTIPVEEQIAEIKESMFHLKKLVNPQVRAFAFPFTDWKVSEKVLKTIKNEKICDLTFGTAGLKRDILDFHLQRYPVEQSGNFKRNLKAEFLYFELRKRTGKAIVTH